VAIEDDIAANKNKLDGGWTGRVGANKCVDLRRNLKLVLDLSVGGHDGAFGSRPDSLGYVRGTASFEWQPLDSFQQLTLFATGGYQHRLGHRIENGGGNPDATIAKIGTRITHDAFGR